MNSELIPSLKDTMWGGLKSDVNNGTISEEQLEKHKSKLEADEKKMKIESENLLILLDRVNGIGKSLALANFYKTYMDTDKEFGWHDFCI